MVDTSVVIAGARSSIGEQVIRHLLMHTRCRVVGLISPRLPPPETAARSDRLTYMTQDLKKPLSTEIADEIRHANLVFHMAWERQGGRLEQAESNRRMLGTLFQAMADPARLFFLSSVAAGDAAPSAYGFAKFRCEHYVSERGGTNLVVGLLVGTPPSGGYRLLSTTIARLPLSLRFLGRQPRAYPVLEQDLLSAFRHLADSPPQPGTYGVFTPGGVALNEFCRALEAETPRFRLSVPVPIPLVFAAAGFLEVCMRGDVAERLRVFFWKDDPRLASLRMLPGWTRAQGLSSFKASPQPA